MSYETDFKLLKDGKKRLSNDKKLDYGFIEDTPDMNDAIFYMSCEDISEVVTRYSGNHHITTVNGDLRIVPAGWVHMVIENEDHDWSQRIKDTSDIKDVENETSRTYYFPFSTRDRQKVLVPLKIDDVVELYVRPKSGTHRLKTADGKLHIVPTGWVHTVIESKASDWGQSIKDTSKMKDVDDEISRTYYFPFTKTDKEKVMIPLTIKKVVKLYVRPSGTHRLLTSDGNLHIIPTGWLSIDIKTTADHKTTEE